MDEDGLTREELDRFRIGEDLYGLSLHELEIRITAYDAEIERLKAELKKKAQEKLAADQLFSKN